MITERGIPEFTLSQVYTETGGKAQASNMGLILIAAGILLFVLMKG